MKSLVLPMVLALAMGAGCRSSAAAHDVIAANQPPPFATPPMLSGAPDVASLVAKVKLAVVNITTTRDVKVSRMPFFFDQGDEGGGNREMHQQALGSGIVIDAQGHVVTNAHVIDGATTVKVKLADEREYSATVVGKDARLDLAVLQLQNAPRNLPFASLGSSDALRVGEYVVAIGNPFGLGDTVTMGIVSAKGRSLGAGPYDDFIQTDASINPGNSGGPLFDLHGQVIGINAAINPAGKGIGFAIPIDEVKQALPELIAKGHVSRGQLGVVIQGMDEDIAKALHMDRVHGALVGDVSPGSPAERAGVRAGDVIVAIEGHDVHHAMDLPRMVASHAPGSRIKLSLLHDGSTRDAEVTLDTAKDEDAAKSNTAPHESRGELGMSLHDEDGHAVVDRVAEGSVAEGKLAAGDVIEEVDNKPVAGAADVAARLHAARSGEPVLLKVRHGDHTHYVALSREG